MRIDLAQARHRPLQLTHQAFTRARLPGHIHSRRIVEMDREGSVIAGVRNNAVKVEVKFADAGRSGPSIRGIGARRFHAVAVRRARRASDEVVALVGREDEERVALIDTSLREFFKEFAESRIVIA